ncbi:HD domain-containing protein [bacterium]|nr:HD domain-containing protein [bacterium]
MRICWTGELESGMILGKSLFNEKGDLLLSSGFALTDQSIQRINEHGFSAVYISEKGTEDILPEEIISDKVRCAATRQFNQAAETIKKAAEFRKVKPDELRAVISRGIEFRNVVQMDDVFEQVSTILNEVIESSTMMLNTLQIKSKKSYSREHAIDTALISILIGRRLLLSRRELQELATGSFLHDIGKLALPHLMDRSAETFTEEEVLQLREHPVYSNLLVRNSTDRFFMAQTAILYHHERQDGLGYPLGVKGSGRKHRFGSVDPTKTIYPLAEIIAVADAYDNHVSGRDNGKPKSPEAAISDVVRDAGTAFNHRVVKALVDVISVFPTGSVVRILDSSLPKIRGYEAVIMRPNSNDYHRPVVVLLKDSLGRKVTPKMFDLSTQSFARLELNL